MAFMRSDVKLKLPGRGPSVSMLGLALALLRSPCCLRLHRVDLDHMCVWQGALQSSSTALVQVPRDKASEGLEVISTTQQALVHRLGDKVLEDTTHDFLKRPMVRLHEPIPVAMQNVLRHRVQTLHYMHHAVS